MRLFARFAFIATAATYFLIFVGGLVRVSGAGLGCPDWPKCFGRWIPPVNSSQLPADMDAGLFNFTLAWIEYINRLIGIGVGLLVALLAIWALVRYVRVRSIVIPAVLAGLLTAFQGWQGAAVVASELQPIMVSAHMGIALLIVSLLIYLTFQAGLHTGPGTATVAAGSTTRTLCLVAWIAAIIQVAMGAGLRGAYEAVETANPTLTAAESAVKVGAIKLLHPVFGVFVAIVVLVTVLVLVRDRSVGSALARLMAWASFALALVEVFLGLLVFFGGHPPVAQLLHLWISSLLVGSLLLEFLVLKYLPARPEETSATPARLLVLGVVGGVALALTAAVVVGKAEASRTHLPALHRVPEFSFASSTGDNFGLDDMKGKITVVSFGYANCQGPCPIMAGQIRQLYDFYRAADRVQFVKVSVDPGRDTLEALRVYASNLGVTDRRWQFLYAPIDSVIRLSEQGFLLAADNLPMGHSTKLVLVDHEGNIRSYHDGLSDYAVMALKQNIRILARELPATPDPRDRDSVE